MQSSNRPLTLLAAVAAGLLAGAVGTVCLDAVQYLRYRRGGGRESPLAWEFAPVESFDKAPAPGKVAKRVIEGFTQRQLPDRWAWLTSTVMHWGYGSGWGALYGILEGSARKPYPWYGLPFGTVVWASGYVALPEAGLYKPLWDYGPQTLAKDLTAHLGYGAGTGTAFWLLSKVGGPG
jgi:hypothetical protein